MTKTDVITLLNSMPDEFEVDELIEKLIFVEKVKQGVKEAGEGKTLSNDEVKKAMAGWYTTPNS